MYSPAARRITAVDVCEYSGCFYSLKFSPKSLQSLSNDFQKVPIIYLFYWSPLDKKKKSLSFLSLTGNKTLADTSTSCYCPHNILSITVTSLKHIFSRNKGNKITNPKIKKNYSNSTCCGPLSLLSATPKGPRLPLWKPLLSTLTTNHRMNQCLLV